MKKILVTGANGQLGYELHKIAVGYPGFQFLFADRSELPLDQLDKIEPYLQTIRPDIIINTAAYTAVDKAEEETETANTVNHLAVKEIAKWAVSNGTKVIHISTDYVFDGNSQTPISETATTAPVNWYGSTKFKGEQALMNYLPEAIIIRTAWVYSEHGNNFVKTMLRLMKEKPQLHVVNDQIGAPTSARDLAETIMHMITYNTWTSGIYHYTNKGEISWFDFAIAIRDISGLNCDIEGVSSSQFPTVATRPKYSLLDTAKIQADYDLAIPDWRTSLETVLSEILNKNKL